MSTNNKTTTLILSEPDINALKEAYAIIDEFNDILKKDMEKSGILTLSSKFQTLNSACGYIGGLIHKSDDDTLYKQLVISKIETRNIISDAAQACELIIRNLNTESELYRAVRFIDNCYLAILDMTYIENTEIQNAINNILELCDHGIEALETIEAVNDETCNNQYLQLDGYRIHERIPQFKHAFNILRPKYNADSDNEMSDNNENTLENS